MPYNPKQSASSADRRMADPPNLICILPSDGKIGNLGYRHSTLFSWQLIY